MTDPRIEAAARALCIQNGHNPDGQDSYVQSGMDANWCAFEDDAKAALAAADAVVAGTSPETITIPEVRNDRPIPGKEGADG